jgi:hypothetical protein
MDPSSDPKHVVNEIRSFCQGRDQVRSDAVHRLSEKYAAFCREANRRLQRGDELLHKGLYAEAIQLAEQDPVLLDLVTTLQFPELSGWEEVAAAYGYVAPPRLLLQSAEALNRAYAEHEPLKPLMKEHRRLALSRAPLEKRLAVLRKLAQAGTASAVWQDDLALYEEARQRQLRADIDEAYNRGEDQKVRTYLRELIGSPWRSPLTPEFLGPIIHQYLEILARALEACQKKGDVAQARQLLEEWGRVSAGTGITPGRTLATRVERVRQMIDRDEQRNLQEMQFQAVLADLEKGIAEGCSRAQLEEHYEQLQAFGRPVPKPVADSYDRYLRVLNRKDRRFEVIALSAAIGGGVLLLVGFLAFLLLRK